ncbi:stress response protein CsbD [Bacillus subtilis]|uniref:CsbD family protein n=1 Tax=Bacillus subtilis TaxID=1423 RepID=UPI001C231F0B|nr:CsbD family protein [Bacillus subtilis]MBU8570894.1 stress response protein CsbD [Bacillus subtilis]MBU8623714.1 stress response protein CsbD [Bacillus subtilis]MCY9208333.1 stress response protein CsbD [Bacillus subtilis]MEC1581374.1 stress response protein CsbD [Bacillus subtilis]
MGNDSVKDKLKGGFNKAKGEVKDKVGDMADRTDMQAEGKKDKAKGEIQKDIGKAKDKFSDKD